MERSEYWVALISHPTPQVRDHTGRWSGVPCGPTAHPLFLACALRAGETITATDLKGVGWRSYLDPEVDVSDGMVSTAVGRLRSVVPISSRHGGAAYHTIDLARSEVDVLDFIDRTTTITSVEDIEALLGMLRFDPRRSSHNLPASWWRPFERAIARLVDAVAALSPHERDALVNLDRAQARFPDLFIRIDTIEVAASIHRPGPPNVGITPRLADQLQELLRRNGLHDTTIEILDTPTTATHHHTTTTITIHI